MGNEKSAKDKIIEAALDLFYYQGFHSTTIRQIAAKADVNQALVSYYFGGKKGLLESLMIQFYEGYFEAIENTDKNGAKMPEEKQGAFSLPERLINRFRSAYDYLFTHHQMTRFIYRELTMDSMLVREVMTTYLAKEKYLFLSLIEESQEAGEYTQLDAEMFVLQLVNTLYMPFLQPQLIREVYYLEPLNTQFKERYFHQLENWIRHDLNYQRQEK